MYVAGYTFRDAVLNEFGLSAGAVEVPLQDTLSSGYIALLGMLFVSMLLAIVQITYILLHRRYLRRFIGEGPLTRMVLRAERAGLAKQRVANFIGLSGAVALFLLIGVAAGVTVARLHLFTLDRLVVQNHCRTNCFEYVAGAKRAVGKLVVQDHDQTFVLTSQGLVMLPTAELTKVASFKLMRS